jgi:hypothetical protein
VCDVHTVVGEVKMGDVDVVMCRDAYDEGGGEEEEDERQRNERISSL